MKKRVLIGMGLVVAMLLTGCGKNTTGNTAGSLKIDDSKEMETLTATIKIGVLRTADSLPVYIADNKNFFAENGVQVELIEFGSASDQSKAMESGAIDAMMTDMVVQTLLQKGGTDMRTVTTALGAEVIEGKFMVVANSKTGITGIEDVAGKSVAISEGTMMEYLVDSYCDELEIDINTIEKVNIPNLSLRYETLMAGEVDMAILPDPMGDLAVINGGNAVIDDTTLDKNISRSVIAFNAEFIENNSVAVEHFIDGYNEAVDRLNQHCEEDMELIYSVANVPEAMQLSWAVPSYTKNALPTEEEVSDLMKWMVEKELIDTKYNYSEVVDNRFCQGGE